MDLGTIEELEVESVVEKKDTWMVQQDIDDWVSSVVTRYPTIETSLVQVYCDRFIESDTKGQYRQEARLNL